MKRALGCVFSIVLLWSLVSCSRNELSPLTWQEQYDLGVRYLSEGNYQEAIIAFTAAIEIDPKQADAYVGRGDAYVLSGKTEDNLTAAQADYETAIEIDETNAEAWLGLADVYIARDDYERALEILREALEKTGGVLSVLDKIAEVEAEHPAIDMDLLVTDAYSYIYSSEDGIIEYHIPVINLESDAVEEINEEIWETLYTHLMVEGVLEPISGGWSILTYGISYEWSLNGSILSLCTHAMSWFGYDSYSVYNISVPSGAIVSKDELLQYAGISEEQYKAAARQAIYSDYLSYFMLDETMDINDWVDNWVDKDLMDVTLSDENIEQAQPFFNATGELCIISGLYSSAGAEYYERLVNLHISGNVNAP